MSSSSLTFSSTLGCLLYLFRKLLFGDDDNTAPRWIHCTQSMVCNSAFERDDTMRQVATRSRMGTHLHVFFREDLHLSAHARLHARVCARVRAARQETK
eukprot:6178556-Pleurochrysis_carterae.AAC.5